MCIRDRDSSVAFNGNGGGNGGKAECAGAVYCRSEFAAADAADPAGVYHADQ